VPEFALSPGANSYNAAGETGIDGDIMQKGHKKKSRLSPPDPSGPPAPTLSCRHRVTGKPVPPT
jgi:hypothetical protein